MSKIIRLIDTTLRDGAQAPGVYLSKEDKLKIALYMERCGVPIIEAGIPAMGEEEQQNIISIKKNLKKSKVLVWNRLREEDIKSSFLCKPDIIHVSIPISDIQITDKLQSDRSKIKNTVSSCLELVKSQNYELGIGLEDASRADEQFVQTMIELIKKYNPLYVRYADTVGLLTPRITYSKIKKLVEESDLTIGFHAHNDLGLASANALAAVQAGAELLDTTLLGVGERAGNCDFVKTVKLLQGFAATDVSIADAQFAQNKLDALISDEWRSF